MKEIDALEAECAALGSFLSSLSQSDWSTPTRCAPMDVRMLVAHLLGQYERVSEVRDMPFIDTEPNKDRFSWWDYDPVEDAPDILHWTQELANRYPPGPLGELFVRLSTDAVAAAREREAKRYLTVRANEFVIRLEDRIATRVLETTIHGMDILDAFGKAPAPTPEGLGVTGDILRGLLGVDLRPEIGDERLALIGTGRAEPTAAACPDCHS